MKFSLYIWIFILQQSSLSILFFLYFDFVFCCDPEVETMFAYKWIFAGLVEGRTHGCVGVEDTWKLLSFLLDDVRNILFIDTETNVWFVAL